MSTTPDDLARELGLHPSEVRGRLREYALDDQLEVEAPAELTDEQADRFLAWHATRYGAASG